MQKYRKFITILLFLLSGYTVGAQSKTSAIKTTWRLITNNYNQKPQSRTAFTITANRALPATGWKLYFNFARLIVPGSATGGMQVDHINGDFFCLRPAENFKGLSAGKSLTVEFTSSDWLINYTDSPGGLYLVWDKTPNQTWPIKLQTVRPADSLLYRTLQDHVKPLTNAELHNQNISNLPADSLIKIFPTPVFYQEKSGFFVLGAGVTIKADALFSNEQKYLRQTLKTLLLTDKLSGANKIILQKIDLPAEAYELKINTNSITVSAGDAAGMFYGIQSLKTVIPPIAWKQKQHHIKLQNIRVKDQPRFGYRAVMLDVARNFQPKAEILKLLDLMELYKLNVFHFHLTDDEGWRLEIPGLPELTQVGGRRGPTLDEKNYLYPALGSGPNVQTGFYTVADFQEVLRYATARHIRVIPEIEGPGHARAAIKAMDARYNHYTAKGDKVAAMRYLLHDPEDTSHYQSVQYYNDNVMDAALPSVYTFISRITDELVKMYAAAGAPLQTIHFGGDEVPAGTWQGSPALHQLMTVNPNIKTVDDLWPYYYRRVDSILQAKSLYLTAWEETGMMKKTENGIKISINNTPLLNRGVHLEVWNNVIGWGSEDLAYKLANSGGQVILSCVSNLYMDMANEKAWSEPGYYWGGYTNEDSSFKFIPFDYFKNTTADRMGNPLNPAYLAGKERLTDAGRKNIIGLQGALWGETLKSPQQMEYMLLPKLLGLAERAWAPDPKWASATDSVNANYLYKQALSKFINIVNKRELPRLKYYHEGFNYRKP